jgi:AraC family transcriptional regulator
VRARRLSEAARTLAAGAPDILAVALAAGYGSHEAFTRAFAQQFGATPEAVRARRSLAGLPLQEPLRMKPPSQALEAPRSVRAGPLRLFGLASRYAGTNAGIPAQWGRFLPHLEAIPARADAATYGLIDDFDDAGGYRYVCGVAVREFPAAPLEFARVELPARRYAVWPHREHVASVAATCAHIFERGLADAGLVPLRAAMFERYGEEFDGRTGLGGLEVWVPVEG